MKKRLCLLTALVLVSGVCMGTANAGLVLRGQDTLGNNLVAFL